MHSVMSRAQLSPPWQGQVVPNFRSSLTGYHRMDIRAEEITPESRAKVFSSLRVNTKRESGWHLEIPQLSRL